MIKFSIDYYDKNSFFKTLDYSNKIILSSTSDTLFIYNLKENKYVFNACKEMSIYGKKYIIELRDDLYFYDGKRVTSEDYYNAILKYKELLDTEVIIDGWVRSNRDQSTLGFIDLNDGTSFKGVQVVYTSDDDIYQVASKVQVGSSIEVKGTVILSEGAGQEYEIKLIEITVLGDVDIDYPLQSKGRPTREFLREIAYLRPRTNLFNAVFRVRSIAAFAIHKYFQERGFVYFHAPLITASDCEGAGEMFRVTTLDLEKLPKDKPIDYSSNYT